MTLAKLTERQHEQLVASGDRFWRALGRLAAKHISEFPEEARGYATMYLQDKCSIYSTDYDKHLRPYRKRRKKK